MQVCEPCVWAAPRVHNTSGAAAAPGASMAPWPSMAMAVLSHVTVGAGALAFI